MLYGSHGSIDHFDVIARLCFLYVYDCPSRTSVLAWSVHTWKIFHGRSLSNLPNKLVKRTRYTLHDSITQASSRSRHPLISAERSWGLILIFGRFFWYHTVKPGNQVYVTVVMARVYINSHRHGIHMVLMLMNRGWYQVVSTATEQPKMIAISRQRSFWLWIRHLWIGTELYCGDQIWYQPRHYLFNSTMPFSSGNHLTIPYIAVPISYHCCWCILQ